MNATHLECLQYPFLLRYVPSKEYMLYRISGFSACDGSCCSPRIHWRIRGGPPWKLPSFFAYFITFSPFCWSVVRPAQDLNFDIDVKLSRGLIKNIHRVQQKWNRNQGNPVQFPNCWCAFVAFLFAHFLFLRISALCCCPTIAEWLDLGTNTLSTGA